MHQAQQLSATSETPPQRRRFRRYEIQCRARIVIGKRHYAGYLHDISQRGARLRTISPIRKVGNVLLRLPDLPPLRCQLRWTDSYNAGVAFELALTNSVFAQWARSRFSLAAATLCDISELELPG